MGGIGAAIAIFIFLAVAAVIVLSFFYFDGRSDASLKYRGYQNKHDGLLGWVYDVGYNAYGAAEERGKRNLERNKARREGLG